MSHVDLEELKVREILAQVVSPRTGIFKAIRQLLVPHDGPKMFLVNMISGKYSRMGGGTPRGSAVGRDLVSASIRAVGEGLERYAGSFAEAIPITDLVSYAELKATGINALAPEEYKPYSSEQYTNEKFGCLRFDENAKTIWVRGVKLKDNSPVLVPRSLAVVTIHSHAIISTTTSGLAAHTDSDQAALSAILEIIERDAFAFAWWTKTSFPLLNMQTLSPKINEFISEVFGDRASGLQIICMKTEVEIPVFVCTYQSTNKKGEPAFMVTAACALDAEEAIIKSLSEMAHSIIMGLKRFSVWSKKIYTDNYDLEINDFSEHVNFYFQDRNKSHCQFLLNSREELNFSELKSRDFSSPKEALSFVVKRLTDKNFDPILVDMTTRDVKKIGFKVVRAIIPGMIQINAEHLYRHWGFPRLLTLRKQLGLQKNEMKLEDLNPMPHPFP